MILWQLPLLLFPALDVFSLLFCHPKYLYPPLPITFHTPTASAWAGTCLSLGPQGHCVAMHSEMTAVHRGLRAHSALLRLNKMAALCGHVVPPQPSSGSTKWRHYAAMLFPLSPPQAKQNGGTATSQGLLPHRALTSCMGQPFLPKLPGCFPTKREKTTYNTLKDIFQGNKKRLGRPLPTCLHQCGRHSLPDAFLIF